MGNAKSIALLVLCLLMLFTLNVSAKLSGRYNGPVKSVLCERIELELQNDIWIETHRSLKIIELFDRNGYLIEEIMYNEDGSLITKSVYYYDETGRNIEDIYYGREGFSFKNNIIIDESGEQKKWQQTSRDGSISPRAEWFYDEKGNLSEEIKYDPKDPSNYARNLYYYDAKNNLIVDVWYKWIRDGNTPGKMKIYEYDLEGTLKQIMIYSYNIDPGLNYYGRPIKPSPLFERHIYEYDECGNLVEIRVYEARDKGEVLDITFKHKYDDEGNLIEKAELNDEGNVIYKEMWHRTDDYVRYEEYIRDVIMVTVYDSHGKSIEISMLYADDRTYIEKSTYEHEYDEYGNLIKIEYFWWGWEGDEFKILKPEKRMIQTYTITYYDEET